MSKDYNKILKSLNKRIQDLHTEKDKVLKDLANVSFSCGKYYKIFQNNKLYYIKLNDYKFENAEEVYFRGKFMYISKYLCYKVEDVYKFSTVNITEITEKEYKSVEFKVNKLIESNMEFFKELTNDNS